MTSTDAQAAETQMTPEMHALRTRPGGRTVTANWTPEGFVGPLFELMGRHVPPPSLMPSPLPWGKDEQVQERLKGGVSELHPTRRPYPFSYPLWPR